MEQRGGGVGRLSGSEEQEKNAGDEGRENHCTEDA
jgi:hypothetical protein